MKKFKLWVLVIIIFLSFYMVFTLINKEDQEALENCMQENSKQFCMKSIYG